MRICRVIDKLSTGGVELQLLHLLPRLRERGAHVEICVLKSRGSFAERLEQEAGVQVTCIETTYQLRPGSLRPIARHFSDKQFNVVHGHLYWSNIPTTAAATLARVPAIVAQWHNMGDYTRMRLRLKEAAMMPLRDALVCPHDAVAQDIAAATWISPDRFRLIPNAVELSRVPSREEGLRTRAGLGLAEEDFVIVHVARLHHTKNHIGFLRAFHHVLGTVPSSKLLVVGDGEERERLEAAARELGIEDSVRFLGTRDDVLHIATGSDAAIIASPLEGFCNAGIEAMACGVPLVTTATGFAPNHARDGEDAFIVPVGDMECLAKRVVKLAMDKELRSRMASNGRRIAAAFTFDAMAERTMSLYDEILSKKGRRG